jgi:hypothetical protein
MPCCWLLRRMLMLLLLPPENSQRGLSTVVIWLWFVILHLLYHVG